MKRYFNVVNASILQKTAQKWLDVPYHHMGTTKGGVDCTKMIALIFVELQLLSKLEQSYYPRDWVQHGKKQVLRDAFEHHLRMYLRSDLSYDLVNYNEDYVYPGDVKHGTYKRTTNSK